MITMRTTLMWGVAVVLASFAADAAASPGECPPVVVKDKRPGDSPLFNTIWTITGVVPHKDGEDISEHICKGDQLMFRRAPPWPPEGAGRLSVVPAPKLAARWGLEPGAEIDVRVTDGGRLCFAVELQHGGRTGEKVSHLLVFKREIDSKDRVVLYGGMDEGTYDECSEGDDIHGGTLHGHDEGGFD